MENQAACDERFPVFLSLPLRHRTVICEPLLEAVDLSEYLCPEISQVIVGGESGPQARICRYEWVLSLCEQCLQAGVGFHFKQTGAYFYRGNREYHIERSLQMKQASAAGIDLPVHHRL